MKRIFVCMAVALMVALGPMGTTGSYALSDAEYKELLKDPKFKAADKELSATWKEVYGSLSEDKKQQLLKEQREWLKSGRDEAAKAYMAQGHNKAIAYQIAVYDRVEKIREAQDWYAKLTPEERIALSRAKAGVYDRNMEETGSSTSNFLQCPIDWYTWKGERVKTKITPYQLSAVILMGSYSVDWVQTSPTTFHLKSKGHTGMYQTLHVFDYDFEYIPSKGYVTLKSVKVDFVATSGPKWDKDVKELFNNVELNLNGIPKNLDINIKYLQTTQSIPQYNTTPPAAPQKKKEYTTSAKFDKLAVSYVSNGSLYKYPLTTKQFTSWIISSGSNCRWRFYSSNGIAALFVRLSFGDSNDQFVDLIFSGTPDFDNNQYTIHSVAENGNLVTNADARDGIVLSLIDLMLKDIQNIPNNISVPVTME